MSDSILVIGGGIAGIQASLDLAEAGAHVLLVEREATIGGIMAVLDMYRGPQDVGGGAASKYRDLLTG
jgi:heterodisulfide reductase subunit A-like polyferredoxin